MSNAQLVALCAGLALATGASGQTQAYGPLPYTCIADSPFGAIAPTLNYFHVETFESGALTAPGLEGNGAVIDPSPTTDSVDCDDGLVDGLGQGGRSYGRPSGMPGVTLRFNVAALGALPTHVGLVWTDASERANVVFQAFDANNLLIGRIEMLNVGDGATSGGTGEDRFLGISNPAGVFAVRITATPVAGTDTQIEIDHVQYGGVVACPADFNADGEVNADDLSDFITCFFGEVVTPGTCPAADFNGDGAANPDDLSDYITGFFGSSC